jgi:hypothetical protein
MSGRRREATATYQWVDDSRMTSPGRLLTPRLSREGWGRTTSYREQPAFVRTAPVHTTTPRRHCFVEMDDPRVRRSRTTRVVYEEPVVYEPPPIFYEEHVVYRKKKDDELVARLERRLADREAALGGERSAKERALKSLSESETQRTALAAELDGRVAT